MSAVNSRSQRGRAWQVLRAATGARARLVMNGRARQMALAGMAVMVATIAAFSSGEPSAYRGVPAVLLLQAATVVAVAWGPIAGGLAATAGAVGFTFLVSDQAPGSALTLILWPVLAGGVGFIGEHLGRRQVDLRTREAATARMIDVLPQLTAPSPELTAQAIVEAATELLGADAAALWRQVDDRFDLLARSSCGADVRLVADGMPDGPMPWRDRAGPGVDVAGSPGRDSDHAEHRRRLAAMGVARELRLHIPAPALGPYTVQVVWRTAAGEPTESELLLAQRLADLAGMALEQAERKRAQQELNRTMRRLQAGLLPQPVLVRSEIGVETRYRPGDHRLMLGGDFYDVIEREDGALLVLIGDVVGHGADAAALASRLRTSWRALVLTDTPLEALPGLLDTFCRLESSDEETFATACLAEVRPDRGEVSLVLAGHPPAILIDEHGVRLLEQPAEPPLGLAVDEAASVRTHTLGRSWALLFLTDGLFEGRSQPGSARRLGLDALVERIAEQTALSGTVDVDALVADAESANGGGLDDDVAVVYLSAGEVSATPAGGCDAEPALEA